MEKHSETCDELYECLLRLKTKEDCRLLLSDLCTFNEIEQMAGRVKAARLLLEGHTYSQIISETEISPEKLKTISLTVPVTTPNRGLLSETVTVLPPPLSSQFSCSA